MYAQTICRILCLTDLSCRHYEMVIEDYYSCSCSRACLKNHSRNLHAPLCGIFCSNSVAVARYDALIRAKSPTNCDIYLAESIFQTRSNIIRVHNKEREEIIL